MRSQSRGARAEGEEDEEEEEGVTGAAWPWGAALPATPQRQQALRASRASGSMGGGPSARGRSCRPILLLPGRILHSLTPPRSSGTAPSCKAHRGKPVRNSKLWNARGMLTEGEPRVRHATGNKSLWGAGVKLNPGWWLLEEFLAFSLCFSLLYISLSSPACCWWGPCVVGMVGCLCTLHCGAKNNHHGELGK